ncbi:unnamed protein product [Parnassius apollo]|uniref:(apollo) hypothetical protein n=1 Tax=Parnassius apollo TaxID=110799 RepID=A0A8S3XXN3_PARAO|nr:unnamed protein product [Parnassius apollo]
MAPTTQGIELNDITMNDGDRVVISGMSGLFPKSRNVKDLADILYNKVDPIETDTSRWNFVHPEMVRYFGKIPNVDRFDCQFFKVNNHVVYAMDAMSRKLLEQAYQAIYDAGLSPEHLQGKDVGVYIGSCHSETDKTSFYNDFKNGIGISGCSKSMFANRISYWLDVKGPSLSLDQSGCSSMVALEEAVNAIKRGEIEAALVGGSNLSLHPQSLVHFGRAIKLSEDGKTRSFDANANGCVKSEGISVVFLQKAKDALRIYANVVHVKSEFNDISSNIDSIPGFYRDPAKLSDYLKAFYKEAGVSPELVEYVEAFGAGIPEVDKAELKALGEVFCRNKSKVLQIGSIMSSTGYTESASGLLAITKVLLAYQSGKMAATLHCQNPREDVDVLRDGKIRIVTENEPFNRSYVAVNNFSLNGVNAHVLLNGEYKPKQLQKYKSSIPYLVTASGRHESTIETIFDDLTKRPLDPEEVALLHNIDEKRINGHLSRGYAILDTKEGETVCLDKKVKHFDGLKRPLWFVYSGMGSQWTGMGTQLMQIPRFAATMKRIQKALKPKGLDIIEIITSTDKTVFNSVLHSFLGISSIQIALTDVLKEMGIVPDKIIGHSLGELGCAYGDGCLTVEEMILASYYRGRVATDIPVTKGAMAAVGLGYQQIRNLVPPEIVVACHNGPDSCTISGPVDDIEKFVEKLQAQGIFAKAVPTNGIAFHSPYVSGFGETHTKYLREIMTPRERSERWLSTSVPPERWHEPTAKFSCPEYHNNNMMSPVLFEEILRSVPPNAVLIEIAPHGLLQPILKRSVPADCRNIALTRRGHPDNALYLLNAIGQLYMEGFNPKIANIYPKIEFPVSTETPSLSHLVEWIHDEKWDLPLYDTGARKLAASAKFLITLHDDEFKYFEGSVIKGKTVFPFAAALVAIWDTMAMVHQVPMKQSVQFRDVQLFSQPILHEQRQVRLTVSLHRGSGQFEISDDVTKVAAGYIYQETTDFKGVYNEAIEEQKSLDLDSEDIYALLQEKEYSYSGDFRSIYKANLSLTEAQLVWQDNWVTLIDGMLQLNALRQNHGGVSQPVFIRRLCIDVKEHVKSQIINLGDTKVIRANLSEVHDFTRCGGILLENVQHHNLPLTLGEPITLKSLKSLELNQEPINKSSRIVLRSDGVGDLNTLHWEIEDVKESGINVQVHYAGINDRDMRKATGTIPVRYGSAVSYGMDFSGTTESGQNVMGVVKEGALSSSVLSQPELLWNVPKDWSLEDAATIPLAYCLAFYCLNIKAKLTSGMNVFIFGGAGAMGQAAISIAIAHGCRVFTAVSSNDKKRLLLKLFPSLNENDIGSSLNSSFLKMVVKGTNGKGCDIVISNAVGDFKNIALNCCAPSGITIDTALALTKERFSFGLNYLKNQKTYISVDFSSIFIHNNTTDMKVLHQLVSEGIERGYVRPLTRIIYDPSDVTLAFKLLEDRRNHGRVLLRLNRIIPRDFSCSPISPESFYLVVCEDSFGLKVVDRLISRGLKNLRLYYPQATSKLQFKLQCWQKLGVSVELLSENLSDSKTMQLFICDANSKQLDGVCVVATNSKSASLNKTTLNDLDIASRDLCPRLKHFLIVSLDADMSQQICLSRIQKKLPATELILTSFEKSGAENKSASLSKMSCLAALNAVEAAISSSSGLFTVEAKEPLRPSLLKQISSITGIDVAASKDSTLESLGLLDYKVDVLSKFLHDKYNLTIDDQKIRQFTAKSIHELEDTLIWTGFKKTKGLRNFFSYVDSNELLASTTMVQMQTQAYSKGVDDFDVENTYLYILPGLEGHHERFRLLCERLKIPALVLQPGFHHNDETVQEQARRYAEILLKKMKLKDNFYLVGYESGILVTLEMVSILEERGLKGTVFCIGVPPAELQTTLEEHLKGLDTDDEIHKAVIKTIFGSLIEDTGKLEQALDTCDSLDEKVETAVQIILTHKGLTSQYIRAVLKSAIDRIEQVRCYKPQPRRLNSKIVMICADSVTTPFAVQEYSKQPVDIYHLETPLGQLTRDLRCTTIINHHLSTDLVEAFEKKSFCEPYRMNTNFMVFKQWNE